MSDSGDREHMVIRPDSDDDSTGNGGALRNDRERGRVIAPGNRTLSCETDKKLRFKLHDTWKGVQKIESSVGKEGTWSCASGPGMHILNDEGCVIDVTWSDGSKDTITKRDGRHHVESIPGKPFYFSSFAGPTELE